jgi:hypothetical protein
MSTVNLSTGGRDHPAQPRTGVDALVYSLVYTCLCRERALTRIAPKSFSRRSRITGMIEVLSGIAGNNRPFVFYPNNARPGIDGSC